jgi:activator of HSP90 ATPase
MILNSTKIINNLLKGYVAHMDTARKTFPQESIPTVTKTPQKTNKSSFQARKIPEFHQGTPASSCVSLRDKFNNYITENYNQFTEEERKKLWTLTSEQLMTNPNTDFIEIIKSIIEF